VRREECNLQAFSGDTYELVKNIPLTGHELDKDSRRVPDNGFMIRLPPIYLGDRADGLKKEGVKGSIESVDIKDAENLPRHYESGTGIPQWLVSIRGRQEWYCSHGRHQPGGWSLTGGKTQGDRLCGPITGGPAPLA